MLITADSQYSAGSVYILADGATVTLITGGHSIMQAIPASDIVNVNPGVIGSGGNPLSLNGVMVSQNSRIPTGGVLAFTSAAAVSSFFGPASDEYALAQIYFLGYDNSTLKPGTLYFAPFANVARSAWLQGGSLAAMTLTQLQALNGTLIITVDGVQKTSATINLSAATSFSNAATLIAAGFTAGPTVTWDAITSTFIITSTTTGATSTIGFATGTLSTALMLTAATGAITSQGAAVDTPATAMNAIVASLQNWVDFMTLWEPVLADKQAFAVWTTAQNQRYAYIAWDTDGQAIVNGSTTCFGAIAKSLGYEACVAISGDASAAAAQGTTLATLARNTAAFVLGSVGSFDFSRTNGRATAAFKSQAGMLPTVTNQQLAANLLANGYSFYGAYATANQQFNFLYNGQMSGKWKWLDTFTSQVYMNAAFQLALMSLLTGVGSIPYTEAGYSLIRAAMTDPITQALNFGAIRAGVSLSALQIAQINSAAGKRVDDQITRTGYYLQIVDPGSQVRGNRGTPVINFWYTDGGAIQKITVASIDIL